MRNRPVAQLLPFVFALMLGSTGAYGAGEPSPGALSANTVHLPAGPGSVRGLADDLGVDGFSGQVQYQVPVDLPAGRAGLKPSLAFSYSGELGNGSLGVGWTLSTPAIRRSTRMGVPSFTAADELELIGMGGGGRLVALPDGSWRVEKSPYGAKIEGSGDGFVVTTQGGVRSYFGTSAASRQSDGSRVTAWFLERVVHPTGESLELGYLKDSGQVYLSDMHWGPSDCYRAALEYEPRKDAAVSLRSGLRVQTAWRLRSVRVESHGETLRLYQLSYDEALPLSRLAQIRMLGRGEQGELPPLTFSYAPLQEATAQEIDLGGWALNQGGVSLVDVDGDGMTDLLRLDPLDGHSWRKGWGDRFGEPIPISGPPSASLETTRVMDVDGDTRPELVLDDGSMWQVYRLTSDGWVEQGGWAGTESIPLFDPNLFLADLNGDGRVDLIRNTTDSLQVKWNRPDGLSDWEVKPAVGTMSAMLGPNLRLQEVNGDGLADVIEVTPDFVHVYLGAGDGTFVDGGVWFYPWMDPVADLSELRFGDLNRDGLMDVVRLLGGNVLWYPGAPEGGFSSAGRVFPQPTTSASTPVVALADINGNGSDDVVWSTPESNWRLDLAGATTAGMLTGIDNGLGKTVTVAYDSTAVLSTVAEGAGNAWSVKLPVSIPIPSFVEISPGAGAPVRRLRYAVRDGFWDPEERRFAGFLFATNTSVGSSPDDTLVEETTYHQGLGEDRALRGLVVQARKRNGAGVVYTTDVNRWEARPVEGVPDVPLLRKPAKLETRTFHSEGLAQPLETLTTWTYDARVRPIEESGFGRLDLQGDERFVQLAYGSDETTWVHDVVCEEKVFTATQTTDALRQPALQRAAQPASRTRTIYGDAFSTYEWDDPSLCRVGRGLVRKQLGWLEGPSGHWVTQKESRYDAWDNVVASFEGGVWRNLSYDADGLFPMSENISPSEGRTLSWTVAEWDKVLGVQKRVTDANGITIADEYDSLGRVVSSGLDGQAPHVRYVYDWTGPQPKTWTWAFDGTASELDGSWTGDWKAGAKWRQTVEVTNGAGESLYKATRLDGSRWIIDGWKAYDARGRVTTVAESFYSAELPTALPDGTAKQTLIYDALARVTRQTLPTQAVRSVAYSAFGATTSTEGLAPVSTTLDGLGRILRTERTVNGVVESVDAEYDEEGRITAMSLNGGAARHTYQYDSLGRLVAAADPDIGRRTLEYNDFGWLTKHTNGAGQSRTFTYDAGGRLLSTGGDGAVYTYHYDEPKPGTDAAHVVGRLAWVEEPRGEAEFSYDELGRTVHHIRTVAGRWADEILEYGLSGLQTRGSVDGLVLTPTYDAAGRPVALENYWKALELDASGRVLSESYGNGVTETYDRDRLGMPSAIAVKRTDGKTLYGVNIGRNAWGAPTWVDDTDNTGLNHSATFAYDAAGRLADVVLGAARQGSGPATGPGSFTVGPESFHFSYSYDGLQNITSRTASGPKALDLYAGTYRYGERGLGPRQLSSVMTAAGPMALTYDQAGRVLTQGGRTLTYNGLDQLVQVSIPAQGSEPAKTVTHSYGYDGLRTITEGDGGSEYWLTANLVERDGKREWYLRQGDRTLVRLTLNPTDASASKQTPSSTASAAKLDTGIRKGMSGLLGTLIVAALGLALVAAMRAGPGRRVRPMISGVVLAALAATSCGGCGQNGTQSSNLRWQIASAVYFHGGIAAGPVLMTREDGSVFEERRYEPFGAPVDAYHETANAVGSVGDIDHRAEPLNALNKETDPTSGYSYHGARWLSPQTATWLTPDPPVKAPDSKFLDDPWGLNPYQYVKQNPVLFWDPDGQEGTAAQQAGAFAWGFVKGGAKAVAIGFGLGLVAGVCAPLAVAIGVGMTAYAAYQLVNGGAKALAQTGERIATGQGTLQDFDTVGELLGGLAAGRMAKAGFAKGQVYGQQLKGALSTPKVAPVPVAACEGGACPCSFVAATLVNTDSGQKPIEEVQLGERIGPESDECAALDTTGWVEVHLETTIVDRGEEDPLRLELLRPATWLIEHPARVGERIAIELDEFKLRGEALVTFVGRAPHLAPGRRCPVIGRLEHSSREVISLTLDGDARKLNVTRKHPIYSADRDDWVNASDLLPGEKLRTDGGTVSVKAVSLDGQPRSAVFDLQVAGTHSYYVHAERVLAHNCPTGTQAGNAGAAAKGGRVPHRTPPRIEDGNLKEGWAHIDARHVTGDHPAGPGDLFPAGTTREQLSELANDVVEKGVRVSDPAKQIQTFEMKTVFNGVRAFFRVVVDSDAGNRVITMFPAQGGH